LHLSIHCASLAPYRRSRQQGDALPQIEILLVDMPRLVREMIASAVAEVDDMRVVGAVSDRLELADAVRRVRPTFVVLGLDGDDLPAGCLQLFDEHPKLKVLGIESDAGRAYLYELRPEKRPLGAISPADAVIAMRQAAAGGA
jgi:DNA-binding NarL/FixJ family response regulator